MQRPAGGGDDTVRPPFPPTGRNPDAKLKGLYSAAAGMIAQQTRIDSLANDIANVNTVGYKQLRLGFRDLVYNQEAGMRVGAGSALVDGGREFTAGAFMASGNPLSVAIAGPGFLQVRLPDGRVALTRNG